MEKTYSLEEFEANMLEVVKREAKRIEKHLIDRDKK